VRIRACHGEVSQPLGFGDPPVLVKIMRVCPMDSRGDFDYVELDYLIMRGTYVSLRAGR
jgi:hypothetical protein